METSEVVLTNGGLIKVVLNDKVIFCGTPEELRKKKDGIAVKEFVSMLKQIIKKCEV